MLVLANQLKNILITALLSLTIVFILCPQLSADETKNSKSPVNIDADTMDYDNASDVYHAQGSVVITYDGGVLTADDVEFEKKNNIATAYGNAVLKMGADTLAGNKIVFNVENKTGVAYKGRAFYAQNHFYIKGDEIQKTGEHTYKIIQPVATTCDGDKPDWEIAGSEMKVTLEGYGLMKNARMVSNKVPFFYSPLLPFPAKTKRQSGFLFPYLSYSKDKDGVDIEIPYFWAISPQMDATLYSRYIEKRGLKEGAEFRYYAGEKSFGTFYGDYLDDNKHVTDTTAGAGTNQQDMNKRWSYYLNHQTNFDSQSYLRTDLRRVSDNWYFRDFSAHNYYRANYSLTEQDPFKKVPFLGDESLASLESTVRLYKGWSNYNLTALMSSTDNLALTNNDSTLQKYPEITFTGIKQPLLKSPLYYEFTAIYDYFYRGAGQKGHFVDVNPTFSVPFNLSRYAKVIPQVSIRETFWSREDGQADGGSKSGTRSIYNFSMAMNSQVSRVFDVNVQRWDKVRHEIKPEISYAYAPNIRQDNMPDYMPAAGESNALTWGLINTFTAKLKNSPVKIKDSETKQKDSTDTYSYLEFLRVKLFQTYDINEAKKNMEGIVNERRPLSELGVEVDFKPHQYLSFGARNQYSVYNGWTVTNYDMTISDWRGDSATLSYRYTLNSIEEIDVSLKAVITDKIDGTFISRRDQFNSRSIENTIGLVYHKQCWAIGLEYSKTDSMGLDSQMTTDTKFILKLSLTGLGKFGL